MEPAVHIFIAVTVFLFGAVVGSFLNVVILRLPAGQSVVRPASRCPHCGLPIRSYDNVPILSFFFLGGKCRDCGARISPRYPLIEFMSACLATGLYLKYGLTPSFGVFFLFCEAMLVTFWIDLDHMIIPDVISLNGIAVGVLAAMASLIPGVIWATSLIGAVLGGMILYIPAIIYEKLRGVEGLGRGDIKLLTMIGAFTGPTGVVFVLFLSSFTGCLTALVGILFKGLGTTTPIPFGPFLTASAVFFVFAGQEIIEHVLTFSHLFWTSVSLIGLPAGLLFPV